MYHLPAQFNLRCQLWLTMLLFAAVTMLVDRVQAGCYHPGSDGVQRSIDPFGKLLPSNIRKTYAGGEFQYFVLPTGAPCNGPNCQAPTQSNMTSTPVVLAPDRVDLSAIRSLSWSVVELPTHRLPMSASVDISSITLDGLLRPPTI